MVTLLNSVQFTVKIFTIREQNVLNQIVTRLTAQYTVIEDDDLCNFCQFLNVIVSSNRVMFLLIQTKHQFVIDSTFSINFPRQENTN